MKKIVTITGIRPDFIRMSEIFKKLDENFEHILIHTGQHYDKLLSDVFFEELDIREPDYNLNIGGVNNTHYHQLSELTTKIIELFKKENINPDLIFFLGDSNSVCSALPLKKEGYRIAHIEAGMRSGDNRMLEEINRKVCDHCSDYHFVYHENYKNKLLKENINEKNVFVVGNTIVEVFKKNWVYKLGEAQHILLDIHRPENFNYKERIEQIILFSNSCIEKYNKPVKMLKFNRTLNKIKEYGLNLGKIELVDLMSYKKFLEFQNESYFIISDSGTAQEEPALLNKKVVVPRDFTERPESVINNCSFMLNLDSNFDECYKWIESSNKMDTSWLGDGQTSQKIIEIINQI